MSARELEGLLADHFEGELDDARAARLDEILAADPDARERFAGLVAVEGMLIARATGPVARRKFTDRVMRTTQARDAKRITTESVMVSLREQRDRRRWRWRLVVAATAAAASLMAAAVVWMTGTDTAGSVVAVGGDGSERPLRYGQVIATPGAEALRIALADGSSLEVSPESKISVQRRRNVELLSGQLSIRCEPDKDDPFTITAAGTHVTAVGTEFIVRSENEWEPPGPGSRVEEGEEQDMRKLVTTVVLVGLVRVTNQFGSVDARAGEAVVSRPGTGPSKTTAWLSELPPEAQGEGVTRIVIEAESMKIEPPMITRRDAKASGESMVLAPRPQGGPVGPLRTNVKGGALTKAFTVERPGSYILMARCRWPDGGSNSFLYSVDGGKEEMLGNTETFRRWHWVTGRAFSLKKGEHTVAIKTREMEARLDVLLLVFAGGVEGQKLADGAKLSNGYVTATATNGSPGVAVRSNRSGVSAMVVLKGGEVTGPLGSVDLLADGKTVGYASGAAKARIRLREAGSFAEVIPGDGAEVVEIGIKGRFALVPGFHVDDVLLDPTMSSRKELCVPAENFMMVIPEGGGSAFVITWPRGGGQIPVLVQSGSGKDARYGAVRINTGGKPVFVGVLDHVGYVDGLNRGLDFTKTVRGRRYKYATVETGIKVPFSAHWWTVIAKAPGKPIPEQPEFIRSSKKPSGGGPVWMWMLKGKPGTGWGDILSGYQQASVIGAGGKWQLDLEQRWGPYLAAILYPKSRAGGSKALSVPPGRTPPNRATLSEILYDTLGQKEVHEIVGFEGFAGRWVGIPEGQPSIPATCAGWGVLPRSLKGKDRKAFIERTQACYNFCYYNKARIDEFRDAAKSIIELCRKRSGDPKLKALAERTIHYAQKCEEFWEEDNLKFRKTAQQFAKKHPEIMSQEEAANASLDAKFFKRMHDYYDKVFKDWAHKDNAKAMKMISRSHWTSPGGMLDGIVWNERKLLNRTCQEATLAGADNPEARQLALEVRAMVRKAMFKPHMKEGAPARSRPHYVITPQAQR